MEQTKIDEDIPDRIVETFTGRKILVTGGTGFLGKVLIEKFLRCLPDIAHVYMLIRPKKGKNPKQRLEEILNSAVRSTFAGPFSGIPYCARKQRWEWQNFFIRACWCIARVTRDKKRVARKPLDRVNTLTRTTEYRRDLLASALKSESVRN